VQPLGSETPARVDIRIVAATNRDLREMVKQRQFREDLYYRLDVQNLRVPPLREHLDDIDSLANHFLGKFCAENGLADMAFEPAALAALQQHDWPGNVRELNNVVQRCALNAAQRLIARDDVQDQMRRQPPQAGTGDPTFPNLR
jgi:transcriptional regulator with GAF, ATPase, and Fis domain